jgi:hypothetical protein
MSVTPATNSSNAAASTRPSRAIVTSGSPVGSDAPSPARTTPARDSGDDHMRSMFAVAPRADTDRSVTRGPAASDAARGSTGAPTPQARGAFAAGEGAALVMGAGQPSGTVADRPSPTGPATSSAPTSMQSTGAWNASWQARFEQLQLAPADIEFLATSGYSDDELQDIASQLGQVEVLDASAADPGTGSTAPVPGVDAGTAASANGPLESDVLPSGGTAWNDEWAKKFGQAMERMGLSPAEIDAQLRSVEGQPFTEQQLVQALAQMESSVGAFDDEWRDKFTKLLSDMGSPAAEQAQVMAQLESGGMDESQLTEIYTRMSNEVAATKPGWNDEYESKFRSLGLPDEILTQLKDSGAPAEGLDAQFRSMLDTKLAYKDDGRLERLEDAKATPAEKWGVMLEGLEGDKFDQAVEQISASHVSGWQRLGSFALNLIPGVYAVQYLTGKDWVTGQKIDRTNPLNIIGAVASGFAGFTAVRGAIAGVQGLTAANAAFRAGTASAGLTKAVTAANLLPKFQQGLRTMDYVKSAIPLVNRFGEAGRLASVGRGYYQSMQLAAGAAALKTVEGGRLSVDGATKATVLKELKSGKSIADAMVTAERGVTGTAGGFATRAQDVIRDANRYGFLQGGAGKLAEGNRIMRGNGVFRFNPFKSTATIAETATPGVFSLGRGVNFGSTGGLAQGLGAVRGANSVGNAGLYAQAAERAAGANQLMNGANAQRMAGLTIADDVQRITTMSKTAELANKLGVTDGGRFRSLLQLGSSGRAVQRVAGMVEHGGDAGYRFGRHAITTAQRYGGVAATPLIGGAAFGLTGTQMQPMWEWVKHRKEIQAAEQAQADLTEREMVELEQLRQQQLAAGGDQTGAQQTAAVSDPGTIAAGSGFQVVGTSPITGGQLVFDPTNFAVVDTSNGDVYDPETQQLVGNLFQQQRATAATSGQPNAQVQGQAPMPTSTAPASTTSIDPTAPTEVYQDPATGYWVDPQTGLMADPKSGKVYDRQGNVVGNVNEAAS